MSSYRTHQVALIVPCFNEAAAIRQVVEGFRTVMPELQIFVFDNNSTDDTATVAESAYATVIHVALPGKGNVVRRMFADVEADIYVMVDGDATYDALAVRTMVDKLIDEQLDMVVGCRAAGPEVAAEAYRSGHQWGNRMLTGAVARIFGGKFQDMLSGYRVFSRRYVKSFPALAHGFETETELTIHALELRMPYGEVQTRYGARPEGSVSKLSTYRDGWRILKTILRLYVSERPLAFFGSFGFCIAMIALLLFVPVLNEFLATHTVPRLPTAVLSASMMIVALLAVVCGLVLDNVARGRQEMKRLAYLAIPGVRRF